MSDKLSLLSSNPPAETETSSESRISLLSSTPNTTEEAPKVSLLSSNPAPQQENTSLSLLSGSSEASASQPQINLSPEPVAPNRFPDPLSTPAPAPTPTPAPVAQPVVQATTPVAQNEVEAVETVASEGVAEDADSLSFFQFLTYASFVLNILLAGAAAYFLFKKASRLVEERFALSTKALSIAGVLVVLHGVFAIYLYASFVGGKIASAPLFATMMLWVLVGPVVGFITRNLLARTDKPNRKAAYIDAGIYGLIFMFTALGVNTGIKTNAALIASIMGGFLMIVPIARSLTAFNLAKARHKELQQTSDQVLIYGLLFIPAVLPVLSFAFVCGLGATLTLFLINFITFDFLLVVGLALIASAEELPDGYQKEEAETEEPAVSEEIEDVLEQAPVVEEAPVSVAPAAVTQEPDPIAETPKVAAGNPDDPIIQFLNGETEEEEASAPAAPQKPAAKTAPRAIPPRKPGRPGVVPPKKPGTQAESAPNAPSRLKAPSKPKKRF